MTLGLRIVGTRFSVLGAQRSDARRWVCEVVARASRTRFGGLIFGSEGSQGLCQMREPSYLLEVDDCGDTVLVVMMVIVLKKCRHWFLLIIMLYSQCFNVLPSPWRAHVLRNPILNFITAVA